MSIKHPIHPSHGKNCHQGDTVVIQRSIRSRCTPHLSDLFGHTKNHGGRNEKHLTANFLIPRPVAFEKKKNMGFWAQIPEKWELHMEKFFRGLDSRQWSATALSPKPAGFSMPNVLVSFLRCQGWSFFFEIRWNMLFIHEMWMNVCYRFIVWR